MLANCWVDFEKETGNCQVVDGPMIRIIRQYGETEDDAAIPEILKERQWTIPEKQVIGALLPVQIRILQGERPDASNSESTSYYIPCNELLEHLKLSQQLDDGVFMSESGEVVAYDPTFANGFDGLVIKKAYLDRFLHEKQYDLIWYVCGEKQYFHGDRMQTWATLRGLFFLNAEGVQGDWGYFQREHTG